MSSEFFLDDLQNAKKLLYIKCGFQLQNILLSTESKNYSACTFELNNKRIEFRVANITPAKINTKM